MASNPPSDEAAHPLVVSSPSNATLLPEDSRSGSVTPTNSQSRTSEGGQSEGSAPVKKDPAPATVPLGRNGSLRSPRAPIILDPKLTFLLWLMSAYPTFGDILFGYDLGYISGVLGMNQFKLDFGQPNSTDKDAYNGYMYQSWQKALIVSILSAGTFVGALASGSVADWIGRKKTIIIGCMIYIVGVITQDTASSIGLFAAGRAVAGLGIGFVSAMDVL